MIDRLVDFLNEFYNAISFHFKASLNTPDVSQRTHLYLGKYSYFTSIESFKSFFFESKKKSFHLEIAHSKKSAHFAGKLLVGLKVQSFLVNFGFFNSINYCDN